MFNETLKSFNRIKLFVDGALVLLSFSIAYYIRFYTEFLSRGIPSLTFVQMLLPILSGLFLNLLFYQLLDLYQNKKSLGIFDIFVRVTKANSYSVLALVVLLFIYKLNDFSRWTLILYFLINVSLTTYAHFFINKRIDKYYQDPKNQRRCLIVGDNEIGADFVNRINKDSSWGIRIIGVLDNQKGEVAKRYKIPHYQTLTSIQSVLSSENIDIVIIALKAEAYDALGMVIQACEHAGVKTQIIPHYYRFVPARPYMDDFDGLPIIDVRHVPLDNVLKNATKRIFDIVFSLFAIILMSPLLIISALMIKFTSPGPIIYKQERVGLNRIPFYMYKFRSMHVQDPKDEKLAWTTKNDPRKTKWGSFMRKTSIDELPQFFNVLKGDMSVIGPRPERPQFVDQFKEQVPRYMIKHQVRPGLSGWAQVSGWRGDTCIIKRIEHDLYYIENWSFAFDIKIILLTIFKGFINKNAY